MIHVKQVYLILGGASRGRERSMLLTELPEKPVCVLFIQKGWDGWKRECFLCEKTFREFSLPSSAELRLRKDKTNL